MSRVDGDWSPAREGRGRGLRRGGRPDRHGRSWTTHCEPPAVRFDDQPGGAPRGLSGADRQDDVVAADVWSRRDTLKLLGAAGSFALEGQARVTAVQAVASPLESAVVRSNAAVRTLLASQVTGGSNRYRGGIAD